MILAPPRRIIVPSRSRVAPRRHRPWCPLYNMAAGDEQWDPTTGETRWNKTTGDTVVSSATNEDCCCGGPCVWCAGDSPSAYTLTIAGVDTASCDCTTLLTFWVKTLKNINGTYTVSFSGGVDNCRYLTTVSAFDQAYSNSSCSTTFGAPRDLTITVDILPSPSSSIVIGLASNAGAFSQRSYFAHSIASLDCTATHSALANNFTTCGSNGGKNGSATLTPS